MLCRIHYLISQCGASAANQVWVRHPRIMPPTENISVLLRTHRLEVLKPYILLVFITKYYYLYVYYAVEILP